jgi:hypothetical protein
LENKVIVVNEYFDHDMFQIKDIIKPDMKLDISADSSEEEVETAMLGRVSDMYLEEILEKSKSNLEFVTVDIDVVTNKIEKILSEELYIVQDSQIVRYSGNNIASDDVYVSVKSLHRAELNVLCSTNRIGPILYLKGNSDDNYREGGSILKMSAETRSKLIRETICKKKADLEADISKIVSAKSLSAKDKKQWLSQNCHLDIYILTVDKKID